MIDRVISTLEGLIKTHEQSALKNPPDRNIQFHFGKKVGHRSGLQEALDAIQNLREEVEAAHEIRR